MAENKKLTFKTDLGISIDKNEDCPTCSICWNCDIKVKDCKYFNDVVEKLAKYEAIGTVEKFRALNEKEEQHKEWERRTVACKKCGYKSLDKLPDVCPGCGSINK